MYVNALKAQINEIKLIDLDMTSQVEGQKDFVILEGANEAVQDS